MLLIHLNLCSSGCAKTTCVEQSPCLLRNEFVFHTIFYPSSLCYCRAVPYSSTHSYFGSSQLLKNSSQKTIVFTKDKVKLKLPERMILRHHSSILLSNKPEKQISPPIPFKYFACCACLNRLETRRFGTCFPRTREFFLPEIFPIKLLSVAHVVCVWESLCSVLFSNCLLD